MNTVAPLAVEFPDSLPISSHVEEIAAALKQHQVVVVAGETGSGKTTQLPKICLAAGFGERGMIGHTQPRRLAARTVAARIAEEVGVTLGEEVGFAIRFTDRVSEATRIKVMTDGLLLTEVRRDRWLKRYEVIIIDEAHERSLNIDFLLGLLKRVLEKRRDLRVIITSATIDVQSFASHFGAPVIEVGGRGYPVEIRYVEPTTEDVPGLDPRLTSVLEEIRRERRAGPRDVLVFQTGEREIFETAKALRQGFADAFEVLPLYSRLSSKDQRRVFQPSQRQRIVLATNVAETSLTVPNIGYVVDPGFARINRYSYRSKLERLPIEPISQASANQRAGRCGRIAPGVCYRLYGEDDFNGRPEFTDPEIRRVNLASVVLQMRAWRLGRIERFPFLEPPDQRAIRDALRLLDELGALNGGELTEIGRRMARLPVDPRLARMLLAGAEERCLAEMLVVTSALAIQDPRERPLNAQQKADQAQERFADEGSDFLSLLKLWDWLENLRESATRSGMRKALGQHFLNAARVREWRELHRQLRLACRDLGLQPNRDPAEAPAVHRALLPGCLSLIGRHDEKGHYQGARNLKFRIFPGSGLAERTPRWLMAAEIAETRRVYARTVAGVEAKWIERAAEHLLRRRHAEPHWSLKRGEVMAYETVTLYGLPLAERRLVRYGHIDTGLARKLFIDDGLLAGAIQRQPEFLQHNLERMREVRELEARGRRRDLLAHDDILYAWYDERLPPEIHGVRALERWLGRAQHAAVKALEMPRELLIRHEADYPETAFPTRFEKNGEVLKVRYRFAPGEVDDGVSLVVPVGLLQALAGEDVEWMVPGLLERQLHGWLKTLPKQLRRRLTPVADKAPELAQRLLREDRYRRGRLLSAIATAIKELYAVEVTAVHWDGTRQEDFLKINVQVVDDAGALLDQGRDLDALQARFGAEVASRLERQPRLEETGLTAFPDAGLQAETVIDEGGGRLLAYPGLVDRGESVDLRAFSTQAEQQQANRTGYARLAWLTLGKPARYFRREIERHRELGLRFATLGDARTLRDDVMLGVAWYCFFEGLPLPETEDAFRQRLEEKRPHLADLFRATLDTLAEILAARFELVRALDDAGSPAFAPAVADIRQQLDRLVPDDLLRATPSAYLPELPRYLAGAAYRLAHLQGKVQKDEANRVRVAGFESRMQALRDAGLSDDQWQALRFAIEEVRVMLFAQPLNQRQSGRKKVSEKALESLLLDAERGVGLR